MNYQQQTNPGSCTLVVYIAGDTLSHQPMGAGHITVLQLHGPMAFRVLQWCHPMLATTRRTSCCTRIITLYGTRKWIQAHARSIHFNRNNKQHLYSTTGTTSHYGWYKPPANNSIIQGAGIAPTSQFITKTTSTTGRNKTWRNNRANAPTHTAFPLHTTRSMGCSGFFSDSNNRNAPKCFRGDEQGHMRHECEAERVFCTYCKSSSKSNRVCRKLTNSTPSTANSHVPTGYHPTATPPPLPETHITA